MAVVCGHCFAIALWIGQVVTMWTALSRLRLALSILTGLMMSLAVMLPGQAAEPSAAGLWQKIEDGVMRFPAAQLSALLFSLRKVQQSTGQFPWRHPCTPRANRRAA